MLTIWGERYFEGRWLWETGSPSTNTRFFENSLFIPGMPGRYKFEFAHPIPLTLAQCQDFYGGHCIGPNFFFQISKLQECGRFANGRPQGGIEDSHLFLWNFFARKTRNKVIPSYLIAWIFRNLPLNISCQPSTPFHRYVRVGTVTLRAYIILRADKWISSYYE